MPFDPYDTVYCATVAPIHGFALKQIYRLFTVNSHLLLRTGLVDRMEGDIIGQKVKKVR
jgi:hypothetical protein